MPFLQIFFWATPIIALASYCLLMLFMAISQKDKYIRSFMWVLGALIIWTASSLLMKLPLYPGALFWNKIMLVGTILVPFLLYHFVAVFSNTFSWLTTIFWGSLTGTALIVNFMGLIATEANVVTTYVTNNGQTYRMVEFVYSLGPMATPVYVLMFLIIATIIVKAQISVRKGIIQASRINLITIGLTLMFIGELANISPSIGKYPVDILMCLINAILITIAIYKYRMLELRFMLTKGIVYALFAVILTATYVYCAFLVERHLGEHYRNAVPYFTTLSALLVALVYQPLYRLSRNLVDKLFHKAEYTQRQALRNFSLKISNNLDLNTITAELIDAIQQAFNVKQMLIFIKNEEQGHFYVLRTSSKLFIPDIKILSDSPVVKWLLSHKTALSREELYSLPFFKSMWEAEKEDLYLQGIEVIVPIISRNEMIGMLMLARKNNNTAYTLEDLDLLTYLGASTAVAIDNARLFARSQTEAITDNLTKLYNHRYFFKALTEQMERIGTGELSLLVLDLDMFKLYNDLYGHVEGDHALERVASIITRVVGQKGIVCRYGGEEFTVILPYHDSQMAFATAEKIRLELQRTFFNSDDVTQRFLTASIGVCTYPHAAPNSEELLKRADLAMYTAKNQGKNQTVIYTPRFEQPGIGIAENNLEVTTKSVYTATIYALTAAIDAKDHYTFGHSQNVAEYATILASKLGLDRSHIEIIREAALLHDIGKIGIPEQILTKTGRLTSEEFDIVKKHVELSITIIKHLPSLNHVVPAVIAHHERWDGTGYPRGLKGENIPLAARCLAITDAFDAMTSNRPYRASLGVSVALNEIRHNSGTQFDPKLASLFIKLVVDGTINVNQNIPSKHVV
jgi:diguanylate cyclase (GGDEF)-like protein/putative nucleotidyltransferase with HDIG domain